MQVAPSRLCSYLGHQSGTTKCSGCLAACEKCPVCEAVTHSEALRLEDVKVGLLL